MSERRRTDPRPELGLRPVINVSAREAAASHSQIGEVRGRDGVARSPGPYGWAIRTETVERPCTSP